MFYRIERVVTDLQDYATVARELSVGLYQAASLLARGDRSKVEAWLTEHELQARAGLPGF